MLERLEQQPNIELRPRYSYFEFVKLVKHADLVITDGGSNQEECYYIGKPCIIMRSTSERQEGIGQNAIICNYDYEIVARVLKNLKQYEQAPERKGISPSAIIVDALSHHSMGESAAVGLKRTETAGAKSERSALENR
jgi:UDP-N-acetylglucosamine 2-epimerase (non-hydrolysing)